MKKNTGPRDPRGYSFHHIQYEFSSSLLFSKTTSVGMAVMSLTLFFGSLQSKIRSHGHGFEPFIAFSTKFKITVQFNEARYLIDDHVNSFENVFTVIASWYNK